MVIKYSRDSLKFLSKLDKRSANSIYAWDPDFIKVTPEEAARIDAAEKSGFVADSDIDWDNLGAIV